MAKRAAKSAADNRGEHNRAVLYARVSGDDRHKEGRNLAGQIQMGRSYSEEHGYAVVAELSEDDRGASGASWELPQLNKALEMARAGEYDVLVVRELDRLSRNLAKQLVVEEELKRAGVRVEFVLAAYPETPEGNLMKNVRASVAEYEREKIKERMTRGMILKVQSGSVMLHRGHEMFGYRTVDTGNRKWALEIVEEEAAIVRMLFHWCAYGDENGEPVSFNAMSRRLEEMRIPSVVDRKAKAKDPNYIDKYFWPRSSIARMMDEPAYRGEWQYDAASGPIGVPVPAIVEPQVWQRAQDQRNHNRRAYRGGNPKHEYACTGILTCGECGRILIGQTTSAGKKRQPHSPPIRYYRCRVSANGQRWRRGCSMKNKNFRADDVEAVLWEWVRGLLLDEEKLNRGLAELAHNQEETNRPLQERIAAIDTLLEQNRSEMRVALADLTQAKAKGRTLLEGMLQDQIDHYEGVITSLEKQRTSTAAKLETGGMTPERMRDIQTFAADVREGILEADESGIADKRRVFLALNVSGVAHIRENRVRVIEAKCELGSKSFSLLSRRSSDDRQQTNNDNYIISATLTLPTRRGHGSLTIEASWAPAAREYETVG